MRRATRYRATGQRRSGMAPQLIYVIRRGEKPPDTPAGPAVEDNPVAGQPNGVDFSGRVDQRSLTPGGWQRSGALAVLFTRLLQEGIPGLTVPDRLLWPNYGNGPATTEHRTYQTLLGLPDRTKRPITSDYPVGEEAQLATVVLTDTADTVLIYWDHRTIPVHHRRTPVDPATPVPEDWSGERFDLIWQFRRSGTDPLIYRFTRSPRPSSTVTRRRAPNHDDTAGPHAHHWVLIRHAERVDGRARASDRPGRAAPAQTEPPLCRRHHPTHTRHRPHDPPTVGQPRQGLAHPATQQMAHGPFTPNMSIRLICPTDQDRRPKSAHSCRFEKGLAMIDLAEVGAFASDPTSAGVPVRFGIYLPGIGAGFNVAVLVIHSADRFTPGVQPQVFQLQPTGGPNDLWAADVVIRPQSGSSFGKVGRYLYRYQLQRVAAGSMNIVTPWFIDPFARATDDVGQLSAFDTPGSAPAFQWSDDGWKVPELSDLVVYEMHVEEFNSTFEGVIERLPYLKSLGVTCLELMPVTSLKLDFDWGYGPLHYLAPNQQWGGSTGLSRLVDDCHSAGVAVILDLVFQHVDDTFPYHQVYTDAGIPSPMIGGRGTFGPVVDYSKQFARDYVSTVTGYMLEEYHVDGFRYDEVTDLYDGPTGVQYAAWAFDVYDKSLRLPRFTPSGGGAGEYSRVIQVPEALNRPQEILRTTYSTATWQDGLLGKAEDMVRNGYVDDAFAHLLDVDFSGYPRTKTVHDAAGQPVDMPVAPFQYINSHDHSHLIAFLTGNQQNPYDPMPDQSRWYKIQPFVIGQYTASGIPMLWQGQEFSENYALADSGSLRIHFRRDMHWEYFYDPTGAPLIRLHRILGRLRADHPALRGRDSFYYNQSSLPSSGIICYRRSSQNELALIFLNFSDSPQTMTIPFPSPGTFREEIDAAERPSPFELTAVATGDPMTVTVPANYGYIFIRTA